MRAAVLLRTSGLLLVAMLLLTSCAQMIRDQANAKMREGNYEEAIKELQAGVAQYPGNVQLRSSLLSVRAEAIARWMAEAMEHRTAGRFQQAEEVLQRALMSEPNNDCLKNLLQEIAAERRVQSLMETAVKQVEAGQKEQAMQTLDRALREVPRHAAATALRRQLDAELRMAGGHPGRIRLAESRPITLDFRGAALSSVLEAITRGSGINFILDRDVRQDSRVTLFLRSAAVEDAIDLITSAHQLAQRVIDPQTVLIYPNTSDKQKEHQEQVVRVFHLANADAKATAQLLRSMLPLKKEPFVDERANMVAIREAPEMVAMAERLVALHDSGDAEVMLEVEILEIKTSRLTELGISVPSSLTLTPLAAAPGGTTQGGASGAAGGLTVSSLRNLNSDRIGVSIGNVVVNLRREVGDFNILANPRIRAKNREKAKIVIGDRFPVVTSTANATGFVSENVNYLDVGLKLDVEPVVSPDDDVTIKLALEVSSIAGAVRTPGGSLAYQVGTRNANTTLRLRDGETQVLAGLISNDDRTSASRIPGLGDLPIAGRLFSSQKDEFLRTELMLAITPRVLRSAFRPDVSQAEMWVGTENAPRLKVALRNGKTNGKTNASSTAGLAAESAHALATPAAGQRESPPAIDQAAPVQLVWKGPTVLKTGEIVNVPIHLSSAAPLRGTLMDLTFPMQQLEVLEVSEGGFFRQGGGTTNFTQSIDMANGKAVVGILRNDAGGATGDMPMAVLRLRAKAAGPIELAVTNLRPIGLAGAAQIAGLPTFRVMAQDGRQ